MKEVSFVLAARDDGYMGNFIERMSFAWQKNIEILEESGLKYEIIVVDFNPLFNEYLFENENLKRILSHKSVKNIIVDNSVIIKDDLPPLVFYEYYAKNVGGIRAEGKLLFMTNSDIIISKDICDYIKEELKNPDIDNYFYRIRYRQNIDLNGNRIDSQLDLHVPTNDDVEVCGGYAGDATMFTKKSFVNIATGYNETSEEHRTESGQASMDSEILWNMMKKGMSLKLVDILYYHVFHQRDTRKDGYYIRDEYTNRVGWGYKKTISKPINENTNMLIVK
jgi:hypothetical protein